ELHEARPAEDRIEGCPQLVAQGFQELILEPSVALSLDARSVLTLEHYAQLLRGLIHRANDTKPGAWPDTLRGTEKPHWRAGGATVGPGSAAAPVQLVPGVPSDRWSPFADTASLSDLRRRRRRSRQKSRLI